MDDIVQKRKEKLVAWLKNKTGYIQYVLLALIVLLAVRIRTLNLYGLKDITTNGWTLGPDLDPFLFLRWAKYIVENGSLMPIDYMRYVPLGFQTNAELLLHPYMIAIFHNILSFFGSPPIEFSAVIYPVFFFAITIIALFFLVKKITWKIFGKQKASVAALISCLFLALAPTLIPRTIAGIPEKESAAFFFLFGALYFFLAAWQSERKIGKYLNAALSGVLTAGMALVWGAFSMIFFILGALILFSYLTYKLDYEKITIYLTWIGVSVLLMIPFSARYNFFTLLTSTMVLICLLPAIAFFLENNLRKISYFKKYEEKYIRYLPIKISYLLLTVILGALIASIVIRPDFIIGEISSIVNLLITPINSRLGVTVAENRQPYLQEWINNFGPVIGNIPLYFIIFVIGAVFIFYKMTSSFNKNERLTLTAGFSILLIGMMFNRISSTSILNGNNFASISFYLIGITIFLFLAGKIYFKYSKDKEGIEKIKNINFELSLLIIFFLLGIVSAKGSVRTVMILAIPAAIITGIFLVALYTRAEKDKFRKPFYTVVTILLAIISLFIVYQTYNQDVALASSYVPSIYNQQWQKAMDWTRENTPPEAVFSHWWDYGYWIQSIGERATVLDGGNAISYWNHLLAREVLTANSTQESMEFLYTHKATHLLIDSTDIGKYTAFSGIGSDAEYDRRSWINTFLLDKNNVQQTKNKTILFFSGGMILDEDIIYEGGGETIFLPGIENNDLNAQGNYAGLGGIILEIGNNSEMLQPRGIYVYQGKQYQIPIKYLFTENESIVFENGLEAGVFLFTRVDQSGQGIEIVPNGAGLYLSQRVVNTNLAKLYLYDHKDSFFNLVHSEDDFLIKTLKDQGIIINDFIYYNGFRGPIKIWEINYPNNIESNPAFLETQYPEDILKA